MYNSNSATTVVLRVLVHCVFCSNTRNWRQPFGILWLSGEIIRWVARKGVLTIPAPAGAVSPDHLSGESVQIVQISSPRMDTTVCTGHHWMYLWSDFHRVHVDSVLLGMRCVRLKMSPHSYHHTRVRAQRQRGWTTLQNDHDMCLCSNVRPYGSSFRDVLTTYMIQMRF